MFLRLTLAALLLAMPPALACSVAPSYRVPNTQQLAQAADLIVLARVEGATRKGVESTAILKPTVLLKGTALPSRLTLDGWMQGTVIENYTLPAPTRSDPAELVQPNDDALMGGCTRYIFARGMTLLVFYERDKGQWRFMSYPFARVSEDVPSGNSRWVRAVREHIAIARLPAAARRSAMRKRAGELARGNADERAIARDMRRLLATKGALNPIARPR
jgi:hypothetical protein